MLNILEYKARYFISKFYNLTKDIDENNFKNLFTLGIKISIHI